MGLHGQDKKIMKIDKLFYQIAELLPCIYDGEVDDDFKREEFLTNPDGTVILSTEESKVWN